MSYTIVGVIGHIDHGKTSLVAALTGVDTDTHPEEKRRGITIDLGFASYLDGEDRFALIDAPGHQKYIGNLLAGVSAVDVGLLVVACDQGIQAQTLEHAAILQSLGVSKLIVAISRIDLAESGAREELSEELEVFLADYGYHDIPIVPLSSVTGEGLDELRHLLRGYARTTDRAAASHLRMPIDRVFTIEGRGCVVAGTLWSGSVAVGDHIQLARTRQMFRVRGLEVHGEEVEQSQVGFRTAVNLVGASSIDITRGDELVAEATHPTSNRLLVQLNMFADAAEVRCPTTLQIHSATTACSARLSGPKRIGAGETVVAVVDTEQPIIACRGQQCLFRKPYPVGSMAGGRVLVSVERRGGQTSRLLQLGEKLVDASATERLAAWVEFCGEYEVDEAWMELQLGISRDDIAGVVDACVQSGAFQVPLAGRLVSDQTMTRVRNYVMKLLTHQAETTEDAWLVEESVMVRADSTASPEVIRRVIDTLVGEKALVRVGQMIAVASDKTVLSKKQRARMEQMLKLYSGSRKPPTLKEAAQEIGTTTDNVASLIRFATQQRVLVDLGGGFFMSHDMFQVLCGELQELFQQAAEQSVAGIRDHWGITRKHAIPILEYCDKMKVTVRQNDMRVAGSELENMQPTESEKEQTIE